MRIQHVMITSLGLALFTAPAAVGAARLAPTPVDLVSTVVVTVLAWAIVSYGLVRSLRDFDPCEPG